MAISPPHQPHCGTGIRPDRDIAARRSDIKTSRRLCRRGRQAIRANPRGKPGSRPSKAAAEERQTVCWREMDSNFRSPVRRTAFSRLPVRITRPSCYADERSAEHRTPAGAGELGGRAKEPVSVKGELRGIERGPQKVVSLWVRIHGAALLKPEFTPDAEGARPQRSAQDASLWSSKPLFRSHRNG